MGSLATVSDDVYEANINDIQAVQSQIEEEDNKEKMVWRTKSGTKYHSRNNCGNTDSSEATQITCYRHNDNNRNKEVNNTQNVTVVNKELDSIKNEDKELKEDIEDLKSDIENLEKDIEEKEGKVEELQNVSNSYN